MNNQKYNIREIQSKSIMSKSGLPDVDWVVNPYTGCRFGCKYCYAAFVGKFTHKGEEWGSYVDVKLNAPELLAKELVGKKGNIFFSSVTDPYQGIEAKYQLTRKCLQVIIDQKYSDPVSILTKSSLVTRDLELFKAIINLEVGMTVTSTGDPIARYLETYASPNEDRLSALSKLHQEGIKTYAFIGPLLPHFVWQAETLDRLFYQLKQAGVSYLYAEHLNLSPYILQRIQPYLEQDYPELVEKFFESQKPEYRKELDQIIHKLTRKYDLPLAHEQAIFHQDKNSWKNL